MVMLNQNVEMFTGDTKLIQVTVTDENGDPKNLTDATIKWALWSCGTIKLTKQTPAASGIEITDPTNGVYVITIDAADTQAFTPGDYVHQSEITDFDGDISVVFSGKMTISDSLFY